MKKKLKKKDKKKIKAFIKKQKEFSKIIESMAFMKPDKEEIYTDWKDTIINHNYKSLRKSTMNIILASLGFMLEKYKDDNYKVTISEPIIGQNLIFIEIPEANKSEKFISIFAYYNNSTYSDNVYISQSDMKIDMSKIADLDMNDEAKKYLIKYFKIHSVKLYRFIHASVPKNK